MSWSKLVALGDSFTSGYGDPWEGLECTSWVEHAIPLLREANPRFEARNFARFGATLSDIVETQLAPGLEEGGDIVTLVAGANDVRSADFDASVFEQRLVQALVRIEETGATPVLGNVPNFALTLPLRDLRAKLTLQERVFAVNEVLSRVAHERSLRLLEFSSHPATRDLRNYSRDLIHPNARGHRLMGEYIARQLSIWAAERGARAPEHFRREHREFAEEDGGLS